MKEKSSLVDVVEKTREKCSIACADLWVSKQDCERKMSVVKKYHGTFWEIAKIVFIPLVTAVIIFASMKTEIAYLKESLAEIRSLVYSYIMQSTK